MSILKDKYQQLQNLYSQLENKIEIAIETYPDKISEDLKNRVDEIGQQISDLESTIDTLEDNCKRLGTTLTQISILKSLSPDSVSNVCDKLKNNIQSIKSNLETMNQLIENIQQLLNLDLEDFVNQELNTLLDQIVNTSNNLQETTNQLSTIQTASSNAVMYFSQSNAVAQLANSIMQCIQELSDEDIELFEDLAPDIADGLKLASTDPQERMKTLAQKAASKYLNI